jgi:hypothetical protein
MNNVDPNFVNWIPPLLFVGIWLFGASKVFKRVKAKQARDQEMMDILIEIRNLLRDKEK